METKESALEEFFKSFRIAFNFILLYSKDHKSFLKSIADLKEKAENLFLFLNPVEVLFMPAGLSVEGVTYEKMALHKDLAQMFHQRKVQSLRLSPGVSTDELVALFDKVSRAPREIMRSGGVATLLAGVGPMPHCAVTDLDYSLLLRGGGEEVRDIWSFMLRSAIDKEDAAKIKEFADNFSIMIEKIGVRSMTQDEELKNNLDTFLEYLKKHDPQEAARCSKAILAAVLKDKGFISDKDKVHKFKALVDGLSENDFSDVLLGSIMSNERFDLASFELFSQLVGQDKHPQVASNFAAALTKKGVSGIPSSAKKKIKELFSSAEGSLVSQVYRQAIISIGSQQVLEAAYVFDRGQLSRNYQYILLDLLLSESGLRRLEAIIGRLLKEWDAIVEAKRAYYFVCLVDVLNKKDRAKLSLPEFLQLKKQTFEFLESMAWQDAVPAGFETLVEGLQESTWGIEEYLRTFFEEGIISVKKLESYFKFFPQGLPELYAALEKQHADIELVAKFIDCLKETKSPMTLSVLENIYAVSSDIIKIEVLQVMAKLDSYHAEFILEIIRKADSFLKKEALCVLTDQRDTQRAMEMLLIMPNPWGKNNHVLLENLALIEELKYARSLEYLEYCDRNTPLWNWGLKKRIREVRGRLDARNS